VDRFRSVVQNHRFERELRRAEPDPRRADEIVSALEFALARHPERGFSVPGTPYSIWPIYIRDSELVAYYTYDEETVELASLLLSTDEAW
jgi:hypothetical protein